MEFSVKRAWAMGGAHVRLLALLLPLLAVVAPAMVAAPSGAWAQQNVVPLTPKAGPVEGQYIVVFRDQVADPRGLAEGLARQHGFQLGHVYTTALKGFSAQLPPQAIGALSRNPNVAYIEQDQTGTTQAQTLPTGIRRIFADVNGALAINGQDDHRVNVDVAVIDTGIDQTHPDLNVVSWTNCSGGSPSKSSCADGSGTDGNGHGSHVAGTIGALDNGIGVVGVAPGARLHGVKVLSDNGSGQYSWVIAGVDWVAAHGGVNGPISVANMSLGGGTSTALCSAISGAVAKGVVFVVAAGNSDVNVSTTSPANCADVIAVSALADFNGQPGGGAAPTCRADQDDTLADFSNWGAGVHIAAPGVCILSTWKGGAYNTISGTSMASPHVAGAAALLTSGAGKPTTKTGALAIRTALQNAGNLNWTDDSGDGIQEKLLDVSTFVPAMIDGGDVAPPANIAPVVTIASPADGATVAADSSVTFSGTATDDHDGDLSSSLTWTAVPQPSGTPIGLGSGASVSAVLPAGTYVVTAQVADSGSLTGSASVTVIAALPASGMSATVDYSLTGNNRHLSSIVQVTDDTALAVAGASVAITLNNDTSGGPWSASGATGSDGKVTFQLKNAPAGCYTTRIDSLTKDGLTWDAITPTNGVCK